MSNKITHNSFFRQKQQKTKLQKNGENMLVDLNENEVIVVNYINKYNYKHYIGKTVKVLGQVKLRDLSLTKIPINFTEVRGGFDCSWNKLTSLDGAPKKVGSDFYCYENKLTSLVGAPRKVGGDFYCWSNRLTSFEGKPESICGRIAT